MQINAGESVEDSIVENMLQAHHNMAKNPLLTEQGIREFIKLSKLLFKIAQKNKKKMINFVSEGDGDRNH